MGNVSKPSLVKLIVGLISADTALLKASGDLLAKKFGKVDCLSPVSDFIWTKYYEKEMGRDLARQFISFEILIPAGQLVKIKLLTNQLEQRFCAGRPKRVVNIDPGYLTLSKLVLATTKNFSHRIYVSAGIFEEVTLAFKQGGFQANPWTYPDYKTPDSIAFFNQVRECYYQQLKEKYGLSRLCRSL